MKSVEIDEIDKLPGRRLKAGDRFFFNCYPGVECFNKCCRNLNLFLYPYDVIRLKKNLKVSSDDFLDSHANLVVRPGNYFPDVLLRMSENETKTCPFLSDEGCSVYADRPDACRTFPLEQGAIYKNKGTEPEVVNFFRPPDFCMGRHEDNEFSVKTWEADQNAIEYHKMTIKWGELKSLFNDDPWGAEGLEGTKARMALMATYNMDSFRDFIFGSSFLKRFRIKDLIKKKIKTNDVELMKFGFQWVKFYVFSIGSPLIRPR